MAGSFRLAGMEALQAKLAQLGVTLPAVAAGALFREAERIMTNSKLRTPVEFGTLRASGNVKLPVQAGHLIGVSMGFGGPAGVGNQGETNKKAVGYAVYVHENLTAHHTVGEAKYIERPLNEARAGMDARLGADIRATVERMAGAK